MKRSDRTTKERQKNEKVGADGGALKEKTRRRETSKTNCAMFHFITSKSAGRTLEGTPPDKGRDGICKI